MAMSIKHRLYPDGTESGILHPTHLLADEDSVPALTPGKRIAAEISIEIMDDSRSSSVADLLEEIADEIRTGSRFH